MTKIPKRLTLVILLLGIFGGDVLAGSQYSQQSQSTRQQQQPQQQQSETNGIQLPGVPLSANQQTQTFQLVPFGINLNPPPEAQSTPAPTPPPISLPSPTPPVSVSAAIQTRHQVMEYDVPASGNNVEPTTLEITSNPIPLNLVFKSFSTPINIQQVHQSSEAIAQESSSEDEPHRLLHSIVKPVFQDIREVIIPIRRVTQQITPVQEEIQTFVARGMSQITSPTSTATFSAPSSGKQLSGPAGYVRAQNQNTASAFSATSKAQSKSTNQSTKQLSAPATGTSKPTQTAKQLSAPSSNSISAFAQSLSRYLTQTQPLQLSAPLLAPTPSQFFIPAPTQLFAQQLPAAAQLMLAQAAAQGQFLTPGPTLFGSQIPTQFLIPAQPQLFSATGGQMLATQPGITAPRFFIQAPTPVPMQLSQNSNQEQTQGQMLTVPAISQTSSRGLSTMEQNSNNQQMVTLGRQLMIPSSAVRFMAQTPGQLLVQPQMTGQLVPQSQTANNQLSMTAGQFLTQPVTTMGQFLTQPQNTNEQSVSQAQTNSAAMMSQAEPTIGQTLAQPQTGSTMAPQLFAARSSTPLFTPSALQLVASGGANLFSNPIEIPTAAPPVQQQPQQGRFIELLPARATASTPTPFSSTSFSSATPNPSPNTFTSTSFSSSTSSSPNSFVMSSRNTGKSSIEILGNNGSQGKRENVQVFGARIKKK